MALLGRLGFGWSIQRGRGSLFLGVIGEFVSFLGCLVMLYVILTRWFCRFHFVYKFLGLPIRELAILPAPGGLWKL